MWEVMVGVLSAVGVQAAVRIKNGSDLKGCSAVAWLGEAMMSR